MRLSVTPGDTFFVTVSGRGARIVFFCFSNNVLGLKVKYGFISEHRRCWNKRVDLAMETLT